MVLILNKASLYSTFGVEDFISLDVVINNMAPSMVEYYLSDLSHGNDDIYLNKRNIQSTINIGDYSLYLDYDDEIYIEIEDSVEDEYETGSLW
jgi:hypothetical protein